jgi:phospholipid/cholesterol/gamma-HCH transport system substrate-binding protein
MMLPAVRMRLIAFAALALVGTSFVGARYVGIGDRLFGDYRVTADFAQSGGIFSGAQVTYRGVVVGKVDQLRLARDGVFVDLLLHHGRQIPAQTLAVVTDRSAVGEQYVDLQPQSDSGPWLHDGSQIPRSATRTPLATAILLRDLDRLLQSVDRPALATTVDELDRAFSGTAPDLQRLLDAQASLVDAAQQNLPQTIDLIRSSRTVLATQVQAGSAIQAWARNLADLSDTLRTSDPDLRRLIGSGTTAATTLDAFLRTTQPDLSVLLGNLVTTAQVLAVRVPNLRQLLVTYPATTDGGFTVVPGDGTAHFGLVLNQGNPPACTTGYGATVRRPPSDIGPAPVNRSAACVAPRNGPADIRGSRNAPGPSASTGSASPAAVTSSGGSSLGQDGTALAVSATGGQSQALGEESWTWLLLSPLSG